MAQLETGGEPRLAGISRLSAVSSALGVTLLIGAFAASVTTFGGPAAAAREVMPGMDLGVLDLLGALACLVSWIVAGWLLYHWLRRSARRGERHGAT